MSTEPTCHHELFDKPFHWKGGRVSPVVACRKCGHHRCAECGDMFEPDRPWMIFCSRDCKLDHHREANRERMRIKRAAKKPPPRKRSPRVEVSGKLFMEDLRQLSKRLGTEGDPAETVRQAVRIVLAIQLTG